MKYCIWNNKGGVGKSFLTFCISTEYAILNPDEIVVVADLCPQANVSEMLLGGNGKGEDNQSELLLEGRTIAGYIKDRFKLSRYEKLGTELQYFIKINSYNENIPGNMFLLTGDFELDTASMLVSRIEGDPIKEAPSRAMSLLKDILDSFENANKSKKITFFIDCNPSFAIYTELAIFASDKLIIPCTGDFASFRGANNVMKILYNINKDQEKDSVFNIINFKEKASRLKMKLPVLHLGIINKARTFDTKATVAYNAHVREIKKYFEELNTVKDDIGNLIFHSIPVVSVKDCNNISLVVNYNGMPISKLEQKKYEIYNDFTQVNKSQIDLIVEDINDVIEHITATAR